MKKIIRITLIFLFLTSFVNTNGVNISSEDNPSVSISKNDLLILSDVQKVMNFVNAKSLNDRAVEQINLADKSYTEGVQFLKQGDIVKAKSSFKIALKNYKRAKLSDDALNYTYLQYAVTHQISDDSKDNKKVLRWLGYVTKSVSKDKDWTYNLAILSFLNKEEEKAAELLESVIKMDKFFFKAYGNLAAVYQTIGKDKKYEKTLSRLTYAQNLLAEKERKETLAAAKKKEKVNNGKANGKPKIETAPPKGIGLDESILNVKNDSKSIVENESIVNFDERARKKLREGQELFDEGAIFFNKGEFDLAIKSFKSSYKKFNQAKVSEYTLSKVYAHLAMSYFRSDNKRNKKKAMPIIDGLSKQIYSERDWNYNIAVMQYFIGSKDKAMSLLQKCNDIDKYFLLSYQNQIALYNEKEDLKKAKKVFNLHEKYKDELTEIYKEYVRTGVKKEGVDLSFLEGAIFRVFLGSFSEYNLPVDIYLHEDLLMVPLGDDYFDFICGNYNSFLKAEAYIEKLSLRDGYAESYIAAFKDGVRTDFSVSE
jgi:tetratricopeptide (TPR) repeat protein